MGRRKKKFQGKPKVHTLSVSPANPIQVIEINELIQSTPSLDPEIIGISALSEKNSPLENAISIKWIRAAKALDIQTRELSLKKLMAEHQADIKKICLSMIEGIGIYFTACHQVPYDNMRNILSVFEKDASKMETIEILLLLSFEKMNVWQSMLSVALPLFEETNPDVDTTDARKDLIISLFDDMKEALPMLLAMFNLGQLRKQDYYFYYRLIKEKIDWLETHSETCQDITLHLLQLPNFLSLKKEKALYEILFLYKNVIIFLETFPDNEQAQRLKQITDNFILKIELLFNSDKNLSKTLTIDFPNVRETIRARKKPSRWLSSYHLLHCFYMNDWKASAHEKQETQDKKVFFEQCQSIENDLKSHIELSSESIKIIDTKINSVLSMLLSFKSFQQADISQKEIFALMGLLTHFYKLIAKPPVLEKGGVYMMILHTLNQITKELLEIKSEQSFLPDVNPYDKSTIEELTKEIECMHLGNPCTLMSSTMPSTLSKQHAYIVNDAAAESEIQECYDEDKAIREKQLASFTATSAGLNAQHESKITKLKETLMQKRKQLDLENQKKLEKLSEALEQEHRSEELLTEEKFARYRTAQEQEFNKKSEKLLSKHRHRLEALDIQYAQSIKQLKKDLAHDEEAISLNHKTSLLEHSKQNKENIKKLEESHSIEKKTLQAGHEKILKISQSQHQAHLKEMQDAHQAKMQRLKAEYEKQIQDQCEIQRKARHEANVKFDKEQQTMHVQLQKEDELNPSNCIGFMEPPRGLLYILRDFWEVGIECYLSGEYILNRLLKLPIDQNENLNIAVNCTPEAIPERIRRRLQFNGELNQFTHENIVFECEPWDSIKSMLLKKGVLSNTFICHTNPSGQYAIYDLFSARNALFNSSYITFVNKTEEQLQKEPWWIMRAIHFCTLLNKSIHPDDYPIVKNYAENIKTIDIRIFLNHLKYLFLSSYAKVNLKNTLKFDLLKDIFLFPDNLLNSTLLAFWNKKSEDYYAQYCYQKESIDYYYLLALFCILPRMQNKEQGDIKQALQEFFDLYSGKISIAENAKIIRSIESIMLDRAEEGIAGLYSEFKRYKYEHEYDLWLAAQPPVHHYEDHYYFNLAPNTSYTPLRHANPIERSPSATSQSHAHSVVRGGHFQK